MSHHSFRMPENANKLHFIGIGGISMSSLAVISRDLGYKVTGSDRSGSEITEKLRKSGICVYIGHDARHIESCDVVIYTAAIAEENEELESARLRGIPCITRAVYLGWLMRGYKKRIGIAGTHGKSTTTSMTAAIMIESGTDPTVVSGAEYDGMKNEGQVSAAYRSGGSEHFIFEACEYTDSFLAFFPSTAVITNVELDHVDYFHSLEQYIDSFREYMNLADTVIVNFDSPYARTAAEGCKGTLIGFSVVSEDAQYRAGDIVFEKGAAHFGLIVRGKFICSIRLSVAGEHHIYNALAAAAAALENGASVPAVSAGLAAFGGAHRRFEYKGMINGASVYDDYAHHPTEIMATLSAARSIAGWKRIICVFQPHSLSRTSGLFGQFTEAFENSDITVFADIYENLEHDSGNTDITSEDLAKKTDRAIYLKNFDEITTYLKKEIREGDIVITMGAGDVYKICSMLLESSR